MNIFTNAKEFLGEIHPDSMKNALSEFCTEAEVIKLRLGNKGGLLDEYIEVVFDAINVTNAETAATFGFSSCVSDFKRLCGGIVRGERVDTTTLCYTPNPKQHQIRVVQRHQSGHAPAFSARRYGTALL